MGRSKFPGKPPKTVTRKRIKVLGQPETIQSDSVTVAENIYYGLSLFNETFGDNEKEHPPFYGFSTKEANLSVSYIKTQQQDAEINSNKQPLSTVKNILFPCTEKKEDPVIKSTSLDIENSAEKVQDTKSDSNENNKQDVTLMSSKRSLKVHRSKNRRNCKGIKFSNFMKTPVLKSVNNILDQHQRTRQLRNSTAKRLLQRAKSSGTSARNISIQSGDKPNPVRKFVLPVRSAHSSRVIKPNKRFIEELEEISGIEHSENEINTHVKKARFGLTKFSVQEQLKEDGIGKFCTKLKSKDTKNKVKKVIQVADSNMNGTDELEKNSDKILDCLHDAQLSKPVPKDVKKSTNLSNKNKVGNSISCDSTPIDSPESLKVPQNAKQTLPRNHKQVSVPTKVLPDTDVPIFESSRVQTRSGTQCEVLVDASIQMDNPDNTKLKENGCSKNQTNSIINTKIAAGNTNTFDAESTLSESGSEHSNRAEDEQSESAGMKLNGGKVILRKARLKLDNKCIGGMEGPFSVTNTNTTSNGNTNLGLTGTIKCGVCGAVRFYRFVKQARKFGIHSCESCRKFISKMIKRQACAKTTNSSLPILQCHKGDGLCLVPPVVRSQQWNLMRCVYKARCPACWLKMCLKCYNIPVALRTGLNALLPPIMRDSLSMSLPISQEDQDNQIQKLISCKISWPAEDSSEKNLFKSAMSWRNMEMSQKASYQGTGGLLYAKLDKFDPSANASPSKKRRKNNRIKVRKKIKNPSVSPPVISQCPQPARQRIELKGPRVKHVCRSASVALGQTIATFPIADGRDDTEHSKNIPKSKESEVLDKKNEVVKEKEPHKPQEESPANHNGNIGQQSHPKRGKLQQNVTPNTSLVSKSSTESSHTISIDFWEQYDPSEIGAKGFALIGSELFHVSAICYLCGSTGKEPLVHCQCCCEPYHTFCLEPSEWNACVQPNWCCPRCTICQSCHLRSGPKLSCIRCRQSFHHTCLSKSGVSARLYSPDRPYVCQSCIKCKSCGSEGVNVHVGNLPLCSMCFKLRQQGNYCPLCQRCYNENDFDTKMMECSECSCWVHARCEGLSDERYQVLSYLPDSIEFTCRQCSNNPNSMWRNAIEAELKAGFIGVIKSLSKNRKACAALKWSPRKECLCKPVQNARKFEIPSDKADTNGTAYKETANVELSEECSSENSRDMDHGSTSVTKLDNLAKLESDESLTDGSSRRGLRRLRQKFHLKECSVRVKNCIPKSVQENDKKDADNQGHMNSNDTVECHCLEQQIMMRPSPTLMSVKRKVNSNEYKSLTQFHYDMEHVINHSGTKDLIDAYREILQEVFPWFVPKNIKNSCGSLSILTPPVESCKSVETVNTRFDDSSLDIWKEEAIKVPKVIVGKTNLSNIHVEDSRSCSLCKGLGDGQETKEGRLLYCGQNEWVHANCALWSNEVFEEIDGSLQNVHSAISRGRLIRCTECGKKGASVGCCAKNCSNTFHYPCARNVGLTFNDDKTVFCSLHLNYCVHKPLQNENEFRLHRPVYVELDRKKKRYTEPNKVKVMIGSLTIDCLGTVVPAFSDSVDRIIPCDYKCSRLYWSTVNPFKIVKYYIRTYIQVYVPDASSDLEHNVTIDHSQEQETEDVLTSRQKLEYLAVKQTLDALIDSVCNKEVDENLAEQNNTDLLPPELKEAIFEDLPHDLLDGISMQDIFPKMTYEDFLAMDLKNDGSFTSDLFKDDILPSEVEDIVKPPESKISKIDPSLLELGPHNDLWVHLETKTSVQDFMDDLFNSKNQKRGGRELKRSKSEVMSNNPLIVGSQRHHQRSCSLTWSCKLDSTYGPNMKRRKLPRNSTTTKTSSTETSVMVLDSQKERSSMFHELRIPESIMVTVGRANTSNIVSDSMREFKYCIDDANGINRRVLPTREEGKEHKRLFWHARQQPRILQVDGAADPNSASECSSPEYNAEEKTALETTSEPLLIPQLDGVNDEYICESNDWWNEKDCGFNLRIHPTTVAQSKRLLGLIRSHITNKSQDKSETMKEDIALAKCAIHKSHLPKEHSMKLNVQIPQLDGAGDISSDDEYVSSERVQNDRLNTLVDYERPVNHTDGPVTCKRCRCTYRTEDSYNRHLVSCDIMVTSDSDSETMDNKLASPDSRFSSNIGSVSPQFITLSPSEGHTLSSDYPDIQATSPIEASVPSPHPGIQIEPIAQAIITPQIHTHATVETVHQTVLTSNDVIVQTQYTRTTTTLPNATVLPQESSVQITEITDPPSISNESSITRGVANVPISSSDNTRSQTVPSPQVSPAFSSTGVQTATVDASQNAQIIKVAKTKSPRAPKPRAKAIKSQMVKNCVQHNGHTRFQPVQNNAPVIQLQQAQRPSGPTVILQQVASPSIMSAYVETLQQQSGQNLQYIAALGGQHETGFKPQFITTNQLVPGAYIQAPSDNLLALQNGGISILPSVQIAQTQPTVLGTIIQQQPSAIQCGVISSEQLLLSSAPTLEMFTDSTGSMFVSNQPMYYGLETIVSNTVMSSSQFMAGAVPQVLASSYQTTTQVFQASKLMEPIVDVQAVSGVPTVTAVQALQNVPGVSTVSNVANISNVAAVPSVASVPNVANMSNMPNIPSISNVPNLPGIATASGVPGMASVGNISGISSIPTIASVSSVSNVSNLPSVVSAISAPTVPNIPNAINAPTAPISASMAAAAPNLPSVSNVSNVSTVGTVPNLPGGFVVVNTPVAEPAAATQMMPEPNYTSVCNSVASPTRAAVDPAIPARISGTGQGQESMSNMNVAPRMTSPPKHQYALTSIPRVAVRPSPVTHASQSQVGNGSWKITESLFGTEQPINNSVRPYFDSKHVSENTSMIKSSISSKIPPLPNHCITQRNILVNKLNNDVNNVHNNYNSTVTNANNVNASIANSSTVVVNSNSGTQNKITMPINCVPTNRPMNRVLPMQAVTPKQDLTKTVQKMENVIEEPTKPSMISNDLKDNNSESKKPLVETVLPAMKKSTTELNDISETVKLNTENTEKTMENLKLELEKDKLQNSSLKIVLQKQLQDGSYKITHNMKAMTQSKKPPQITSVEILPPKQVPQIGSLQLLPIKTFTLKTNKIDEKTKPLEKKLTALKTKTPPVAVKKPRLMAKSLKSNLQNNRPSGHMQKNGPKGPSLMYEIKSQDGFSHTASSMSEVWETVFQAVQNARKTHNLPPLPYNPLSENLGLENNATIYLVEQLPGVNRCTKYKPKFHELAPPKPGEAEHELPTACVNGAARAEPFKGRKVHDMFSWLASRHRQQPKMIAISEAESRRVASTNLPMAMRFRILKETSKESVGVYHSHIHGRGLFCLRDIEAGEMVIEYAGEVIRASLTDKREKYYDSKNIGCYMFKIDDHLVVDATMKGNAARFINHSCEPNCYSRVVDILGKKHILIFALRRILQGEELTYDYKFPFEDIKIPCTCGSRRCRKYLN